MHLDLDEFTNYALFTADRSQGQNGFDTPLNDSIDPLLSIQDDLGQAQLHNATAAYQLDCVDASVASRTSSFSKDSGLIRADNVVEYKFEPLCKSGGSSDDKDLTPAQTRRKAQNRAAQRAFRERKERHVRELEDKLSAMSSRTNLLQSDVDRLKTLLQRAQTENKILKASAAASKEHSPTARRGSIPVQQAPLMFSRETETCVPDLIRSSSESSTSSASVSTPPNKYLDPGAAWDLLQTHPLYLKGYVDIAKVCDKLKWLARCEASSGPVFDETEVRQVIEEVAESPDAAPP